MRYKDGNNELRFRPIRKIDVLFSINFRMKTAFFQFSNEQIRHKCICSLSELSCFRCDKQQAPGEEGGATKASLTGTRAK